MEVCKQRKLSLREECFGKKTSRPAKHFIKMLMFLYCYHSTTNRDKHELFFHIFLCCSKTQLQRVTHPFWRQRKELRNEYQLFSLFLLTTSLRRPAEPEGRLVVALVLPGAGAASSRQLSALCLLSTAALLGKGQTKQRNKKSKTGTKNKISTAF